MGRSYTNTNDMIHRALRIPRFASFDENQAEQLLRNNLENHKSHAKVVIPDPDGEYPYESKWNRLATFQGQYHHLKLLAILSEITLLDNTVGTSQMMKMMTVKMKSQKRRHLTFQRLGHSIRTIPIQK